MRIAIVGGGVSGLVVAHRLHDRHDIALFEAAPKAGGHVNTIRVDVDGTGYDIDTGFIVYNERNYPRFTAVLAELGVATQATTMSFSVRSDVTGLEYNGSSVSQLFVQRRNFFRPSYYRMLANIVRFNREAPSAAHDNANEMLGVYLERARFAKELATDYLIPMGSALWSIPPARVLEMPVAFFVTFFENHGMLTAGARPEWRVITGGSQRYVDMLTRGLTDRIRLNTPVRAVHRTDRGAVVDGEQFDRVVFACHSDDALACLADATDLERELLGALPYQANDIVLHGDTSILPRNRNAWGAWNYRIPSTRSDAAVVTYNMNMLQNLPSAPPFCVSLNADAFVRPESVYRRIQYRHPLYTVTGMKAQERHAEINRGTSYFCGAYWGYGFHEDGVRSGDAVVAAIEASP